MVVKKYKNSCEYYSELLLLELKQIFFFLRN